MKFLLFGGRLFAYPYWLVKKYFLGCNYKTFEESLAGLNNPLDIQCFMWTQFKYISDKRPEDQWQEPIRTWNRKGGDCEDWALFAMACMGALKHRCFVLSFYPQHGSGHATCVYDADDGTFVTMGTFGLRRVKGSLMDIPRIWYSDWEDMKITYVDGTEKRIKR